jgi:hypothetical protein
MILPRIELEQHPYQERTLPIKLKNLCFQWYVYIPISIYITSTRVLRFELRKRSLKLRALPIKLYSFLIFLPILSKSLFYCILYTLYKYKNNGKEEAWTLKCKNTLFSKQLALPMATFPFIYNITLSYRCIA